MFYTTVWSLDKLSNKIYDMRDAYNQMEEGNSCKVRNLAVYVLIFLYILIPNRSFSYIQYRL